MSEIANNEPTNSSGSSTPPGGLNIGVVVAGGNLVITLGGLFYLSRRISSLEQRIEELEKTNRLYITKISEIGNRIPQIDVLSAHASNSDEKISRANNNAIKMRKKLVELENLLDSILDTMEANGQKVKRPRSRRTIIDEEDDEEDSGHVLEAARRLFSKK